MILGRKTARGTRQEWRLAMGSVDLDLYGQGTQTKKRGKKVKRKKKK